MQRHARSTVSLFLFVALVVTTTTAAQRQGGQGSAAAQGGSGAPGTGRQGGFGQGGLGQGGPGPFGRGGFNREPVVGTATIRGRVVASDTGAPVRRAQVRAQGVGAPRLTSTDANGNFELRDLPAGRWT